MVGKRLYRYIRCGSLLSGTKAKQIKVTDWSISSVSLTRQSNCLDYGIPCPSCFLVDGVQGVLPGQAGCRVNGLVVTLPPPPGEKKPPLGIPQPICQLGSSSSAGRAQVQCAEGHGFKSHLGPAFSLHIHLLGYATQTSQLDSQVLSWVPASNCMIVTMEVRAGWTNLVLMGNTLNQDS